MVLFTVVIATEFLLLENSCLWGFEGREDRFCSFLSKVTQLIVYALF